jgi:hypothetical protein
MYSTFDFYYPHFNASKNDAKEYLDDIFCMASYCAVLSPN